MKGKNIYLIGFMGTGKSAVGKRLAERLSLPFFDVDAEVVKAAGKPIADIFAEDSSLLREGEYAGLSIGEAKFRRMETEALLRISRSEQKAARRMEAGRNAGSSGTEAFKAVVSCGGGLALFERNVEIMREHGIILQLTASPETVYERVKDDESRPLLRSDAAENASEAEKRESKIRKAGEIMYLRRLRYAEAADFVFATDFRSVDELCDSVIAGLSDSVIAGLSARSVGTGYPAKNASGASGKPCVEDESRPGIEFLKQNAKKGTLKGEDRPYICSPVCEESAEEMLAAIEVAEQLKIEGSERAPELLEIRVDALSGIGCEGEEPDELSKLLKGIRELKASGALSLPLIGTYRTEQPASSESGIATESGASLEDGSAAESGPATESGASLEDGSAHENGTASEDEAERLEYSAILRRLIASACFEIIDIELAGTDSRLLITEAQRAGALALCSKHDFEKTPDLFSILNTLVEMQEAGADILKVAYMPRTREEAEELICAAEMFSESYGKKPFIAISMGELGRESRLYRKNFLSFASLSKASAPGQFSVEEMKKALYKSERMEYNVR